MRCPSPTCKAPLIWQARFCSECGTQLPSGTVFLNKANYIARISIISLLLVVIVLLLLPQVRNTASQGIDNSGLAFSNLTTDLLYPPSAVLDNFCSNILFKSYKTAYASYSPGLQQKIPLVHFEKTWSGNGAQSYHIDTCTHSDALIQQNQANSTLLIHESDSGVSTTDAVVLLREKDGWKIDSITPGKRSVIRQMEEIYALSDM